VQLWRQRLPDLGKRLELLSSYRSVACRVRRTDVWKTSSLRASDQIGRLPARKPVSSFCDRSSATISVLRLMLLTGWVTLLASKIEAIELRKASGMIERRFECRVMRAASRAQLQSEMIINIDFATLARRSD
jgi:hypothetical protein